MEDRAHQRDGGGMEHVKDSFPAPAAPRYTRCLGSGAAEAPPREPPMLRPGQRYFRCAACRFMFDTGERAPQCRCNWVECDNPACPASERMADGRRVRMKSRFCHPDKCRFFEAAPDA